MSCYQESFEHPDGSMKMSCSYIVLVQDQEMEWKWVKDEMLQGEIYVEPVLT